MKNAHLLEVKEVTKIFKLGGILFGSKLTAVDEVSFTLGSEPIILSIVGESGSGKTTLARMILGIIEPSSGEMLYRNQNIHSLRGSELKKFRLEVQPIFQNPFESFNPLSKIESYLISTAKKAYGSAKVNEVVENALNTVGLSFDEVKGKHTHEFSGGELQRIAIARALISKPSLLVCDEPTSMVDASVRMEILNSLLKLNKMNNMSIVHITHDLTIAYYLSDEIAIMYRGNIVEYGPVKKVLEKPMHPYTVSLRDSVPVADPRDRWKDGITLSGIEAKEFEFSGCKFASRCPSAKELCFKKRPPDVKMNNTLVKCWLYAV